MTLSPPIKKQEKPGAAEVMRLGTGLPQRILTNSAMLPVT
jgi:hypothetical protein